MAYVKNPADDVHVYYEVEGIGPPLVLIHGSATSSKMWRTFGYVDALAGSHRLILIDARGHGRSEKPYDEQAYAVSLFASDVVAVLDDLGVELADYFGYSLGGRVAFGVGCLAPERFRSVVIGGGSFRSSSGVFDRMNVPGALETIRTEDIQAFLDQWERHLGHTLPRAVHSSMLMNDACALVAYLQRMDYEPSLEGAFDSMAMPLLLFAGDADTEHLEASLIAATRLANAELAVIPGQGHAGAIAQAGAVLPLVTSFLANVEAAARQPAYQ